MRDGIDQPYVVTSIPQTSRSRETYGRKVLQQEIYKIEKYYRQVCNGVTYVVLRMIANNVICCKVLVETVQEVSRVGTCDRWCRVGCRDLYGRPRAYPHQQR